MWAGYSSSSTAFTHPESWSFQPLAISDTLDGVSRSLWPLAWCGLSQVTHVSLQKRKGQHLSQDAHKIQEVLVTQETQEASFSKHRWLKPKSDFLVHCNNSLNIYSSTGARARCLLSIQGLLQSLLPVSQDSVPMSPSCQGPEVVLLVLHLCLPPQVSRPTLLEPCPPFC